MSASAERSEGTNPKTGMTHREMKEFIRNHFEEFVNRNNLLDCPRDLRRPYSASGRRSKKFPICG